MDYCPYATRKAKQLLAYCTSMHLHFVQCGIFDVERTVQQYDVNGFRLNFGPRREGFPKKRDSNQSNQL